jgi:hypothetical protein
MAEKYLSLSPYVYCVNNPLKYFDPNGLGVEDVEKLVNAIHNGLNAMWNYSFKNDGSVREVSASIVSKNNEIYLADFEFGTENYTGRSKYTAESDEKLEGNAHTHPYSENDGGFTGVGPSAGDIRHQGFGISGSIMIVEAGTQRFAIEIKDDLTAGIFILNNDVQKMWNEAFNNTKGSFQERVLQATKSVINQDNSGMVLYQSVDEEKKKFEEVQ